MGRRVLVVEDDGEIRNLYRFVLEGEGFEVDTAEHGLAALEAMALALPNVILLDLMMPVMDGWAFAAALEKNPAYAGVPIVVISAFQKPNRPIKAQRFIQKPVELDEFIAIIRQYAESHV